MLGSVLGVLYLYRRTDGGEIWHGGVDLRAKFQGPILHAKFHPHRCDVSPLHGENLQNRPLINLYTGACGRSVRMSVCHTSEPCRNGLTDRDAVWVDNSGWSKEHFEGQKGRPIVKYRDTLCCAKRLIQSRCCLGSVLGQAQGITY